MSLTASLRDLGHAVVPLRPTTGAVIGFAGRCLEGVSELVREDQSILTYPFMKWTLFSVLLLFAPALLFLVMAFMFMPAIFFAAGLIYMIPKAVVPSQTSETLVFIGFFGVHLLIYVGLYLLISIVCAKLLFLIRNPIARNAVFAVVCLGVASLGLFPIYGSGGHGPVTWATLLDVFKEMNDNYGRYSVVLAYGTYFICLAAVLLYRKRHRNRVRAH